MTAISEFPGSAPCMAARPAASWRLAWRYLSLVLFNEVRLSPAKSLSATAPLRRAKASGGRYRPFNDTPTSAPTALQRRPKNSRALTESDRDIERKYLDEIFSLPRLSAADELVLVRQMKAGDRAAFDTLIKSNLGLVVLIARRFRRSGVSLLDLIAEGNIGLMGAAKGFDPERGFRFATYAKWSVVHAIQAALPGLVGVVRLPAPRRQSPKASSTPDLVEHEAQPAESIETESHTWPPRTSRRDLRACASVGSAGHPQSATPRDRHPSRSMWRTMPYLNSWLFQNMNTHPNR